MRGLRKGWSLRALPLLGLLLVAFPEAARAPIGSAAAVASVSKQGGSRTVEIGYQLDLSHIPAQARRVDIWIPLPRESGVQRVDKVKVDSVLPAQILRDPVYGNRFLYLEAREALPADLRVDVEYVIRRDGYEVRGPAAAGTSPASAAELSRFLQPDRLVPIGGLIAARSAQVLSGVEGSNYEKARLLYEDVLHSMKYEKSGEGWGRGDAVRACEVGAGNCTDFHSLFIGMARAAGIPARFVMGLPLPVDRSEGEIPGYHCWAEFHDQQLGWVPLDASEAWKQPALRDFLFGGLDPNRLEFTIGRDIPVDSEDKVAGAVLNYSIFPYVAVDGAAYDVVVTPLKFRDLVSTE